MGTRMQNMFTAEPRPGDHPAQSPQHSPIGKTTLHSQIAERLRDMIVSGELLPGARIPEKELCERFQISRTPLREALKVLATEGLIRHLPQRGSRVNLITEDELRELFPIIAALEALAGDLAARTITDAALAQLRGLHARMVMAYEARAHLEYSRLNREIHLAIFEAAGNASLSQIYRTMELRIRNIRHTVRQNDDDWQKAVVEHEAVLAALAARNGPETARLMQAHVMSTADAVRNALNRMAGSEPDDITAA